MERIDREEKVVKVWMVNCPGCHAIVLWSGEMQPKDDSVLVCKKCGRDNLDGALIREVPVMWQPAEQP